LTLWDFARAAWAKPGSKDAFLELQDAHDQCVCLLLWRLWTLVEGRPVGAKEVAAAMSLARDWEASVIAPLRALRRRLEQAADPLSAVGVPRLGARVQRAELSAERLLLQALEAMTRAPGAGACEILAGLQDLTRAWGAPAPARLLARVAAAAV
jgi:uncharacterized protein (TIGR02444 family)